MEKTIKQRIVEISNELRLEKDGRNDFAKYDYFRPDDILKALIPLLIKYNLFIKFNLEIINDYYRGTLIISDFQLKQSTVFREADSETFIFDIDKANVKGANPSQNSGATLTYAKRYSLMNAFNIADNSDDFDSNEMTKKSLAVLTPEIIEEMKSAKDLKDLQMISAKHRNLWNNQDFIKIGKELKERFNTSPKKPDDIIPESPYIKFSEDLRGCAITDQLNDHWLEITNLMEYQELDKDQQEGLLKIYETKKAEFLTKDPTERKKKK